LDSKNTRCSFFRSCISWEALERDVDSNSGVRIAAVVYVVAVVHVSDINVVVVVPVVSPVFWPRVNRADPVAVVLEAGISTYDQEGQAADSEAMIGTEVSAIAIIRDAVAVVAAALLPIAVVGIPVA